MSKDIEELPDSVKNMETLDAAMKCAAKYGLEAEVSLSIVEYLYPKSKLPNNVLEEACQAALLDWDL
jgi:hypothetical protein